MTETAIALLPIHPEYADAILAGLKKVEFRKKLFKRDVKKILIYASHPIMSMVGYFDVAGITETTPELAWEEFGSQGCIGLEAYTDYYLGSNTAVAIRIKRVIKFKKPVKLCVINKDLTPPQSYRYIYPEQFENILKKAS